MGTELPAFQSVFLHLVAQDALADAEGLGGLGLDAAAALQRLADGLAFDVAQDVGEALGFQLVGGPLTRPDCRRQVLQINHSAAAEEDGPLDWAIANPTIPRTITATNATPSIFFIGLPSFVMIVLV